MPLYAKVKDGKLARVVHVGECNTGARAYVLSQSGQLIEASRATGFTGLVWQDDAAPRAQSQPAKPRAQSSRQTPPAAAGRTPTSKRGWSLASLTSNAEQAMLGDIG